MSYFSWLTHRAPLLCQDESQYYLEECANKVSSLKTYLQVWIDLKDGFSPPHVSYQPGTASTVDKERWW